jgi:hypothetical protein
MRSSFFWQGILRVREHLLQAQGDGRWESASVEDEHAAFFEINFRIQP